MILSHVPTLRAATLAVIALLQAPASQAPPPLLRAPESWRTERLAFPLEFAPELDHRGFEDLCFAPGMFEPGSESYFSYALALRLEGDVELDAPALERFLELYFGGLHRAVAGDRGLATEGKPTDAEVRRDGERFRARVKTFDAFTGGGALQLELELDVHATPRATELVGIASPRPADAPVWGELRAIRDAWRAERPAPLFLNHVYAVVDRATYDALAGCKLLRDELAVSEERATRRADASYSGFYVYGRRTYFEFLPPESAAGIAAGSSGVALGLEREGALAEWSARLGAAGVRAQGGPVTRELLGEQVPWFEILGVEMPPSPLSLLAMEYEPDFLRRWHGDLEPAGAGIARADVLARYAAALGKRELHASAPLADVVEVELATTAAQRERLVAACKAGGHAVETDGPAVRILGPQFRLVLRPADAPGGVRAIVLALRRPLKRPPLALGRAKLSFHGATARIELE